MAVPVARKNSMFGFNPPAHVLGLKRSGQPISLANAFEKPVYGNTGYIDKSIEKMNAHWGFLQETYCLKGQTEVSTCIPEKNMDDFIKDLVMK